MIDTWRAQAALTRLDKALGFPRDPEVSQGIADVEYEIESIECEEDHIRSDYESDEDWVEVTALSEFLERKLSKLRIGVYNEQRDGNLLEVLEEIERILQ